MSLRVVNLGLPKSGTTTLARALKVSGFRVADHRIRPRQTDRKPLHNAYVGELLYRAYFQTGDPASFLAGFDAISEMSCLRDGRSLWPQTDFGIISALERFHSELVFVATRRPTQDVITSMQNWSDLGTDRLPAGQIPGLPAGFGADTAHLATWIDGHYAHLQHLFAQDDRYLELDVSSSNAADILSGHIGSPISWWGVANKTKRFRRAPRRQPT